MTTAATKKIEVSAEDLAKAKARMAQVRPIVASIRKAIEAAEKAKENYFGRIRDAVLAGFTFSELESVEFADLPKIVNKKTGKERCQTLRDNPNYRSAKSLITAYIEAGNALTPETTSADCRKAAEGAKSKKSAGGGNKRADDDGMTETAGDPGAKYTLHFTDKFAMLKAALALLNEDAQIRKGYRTEIRDLARKIANEEAEEKAAQERAAAEAKAAEEARAKRQAEEAEKAARMRAEAEEKARKAAEEKAREERRMRSPKARKAAEQAAKEAAARQAAEVRRIANESRKAA